MAEAQKHHQGFVLVAVLVLVVVLSMLAAGVATTAERAVEAALEDQQQFQAELDMASTRETLLVMLASHRKTVAGLQVDYLPPDLGRDSIDEDSADWLPIGNEIRLDGRHYRGLGSAEFALLDDRGRLSVNWAPTALRHAAYAALGAGPEEWAQLDDIRLDYQDADSLRRLDGAEADEYRRLGLPPPANRALSSPLELRRLPRWRDLLAPLGDREILERFSVSRELSVNLNTAPREVIAALPGVHPANADRLVTLREASPIVSLLAAQQNFGLPADLEESLNLYANSSGDLILWSRHQGTRTLVHWTLTTLGNTGKPWRIEYEVILPRGNSDVQVAASTAQAALLATPDTDQR